MKIPARGGVLPREGEGGRGQEGVCGEFWGGDLDTFFFSGPKCPPRRAKSFQNFAHF